MVEDGFRDGGFGLAGGPRAGGGGGGGAIEVQLPFGRWSDSVRRAWSLPELTFHWPSGFGGPERYGLLPGALVRSPCFW